eukprot:552927_1
MFHIINIISLLFFRWAAVYGQSTLVIHHGFDNTCSDEDSPGTPPVNQCIFGATAGCYAILSCECVGVNDVKKFRWIYYGEYDTDCSGQTYGGGSFEADGICHQYENVCSDSSKPAVTQYIKVVEDDWDDAFTSCSSC